MVHCSPVLYMFVCPLMKSKFDCFLLLCIVVNLGLPKSLLPSTPTQWVGS